MKMFREDENLIADRKRRLRSAFPVSGFLVPLLGKSDLLPEELVQFLKINDKILGVHVRNVTLRMDRDCRIVTLVGEEGGDAGRSVRSVVESEFRKRKESVPIVLLIRAVDADILFNSLIHTFRLTVSLRMITGSIMDLHIEKFAQRPEEGSNEFGAPVTRNMCRNTVFGKDVNKEKASELRRIDMGIARNENDLLG